MFALLVYALPKYETTLERLIEAKAKIERQGIDKYVVECNVEGFGHLMIQVQKKGYKSTYRNGWTINYNELLEYIKDEEMK